MRKVNSHNLASALVGGEGCLKLIVLAMSVLLLAKTAESCRAGRLIGEFQRYVIDGFYSVLLSCEFPVPVERTQKKSETKLFLVIFLPTSPPSPANRRPFH